MLAPDFKEILQKLLLGTESHKNKEKYDHISIN